MYQMPNKTKQRFFNTYLYFIPDSMKHLATNQELIKVARTENIALNGRTDQSYKKGNNPYIPPHLRVEKID